MRDRPRAQPLGIVVMTFVKENATALSIVAAALGGVVYVLLSWLAAWVYEPAGVTPSEVGLGYGPLLLRTAVTIVSVLGWTMVCVGTAMAGAWLRAKKSWAYWLALVALILLVVGTFSAEDDVALFIVYLPLASFVAYLSPNRGYKVIGAVGTMLVLLAAGFGLLNSATAARRDIEQQSSGWAIGIFNDPWQARVVNLRWLGPPSGIAPRMSPLCLLYLGEANGIGVFSERTSFGMRTWRLPLDSVSIEILPNQSGC